jgi:gluconate 5-dehydrogenase
MINTFDLSEKIVLITGGYGHLGEAVVNHLAYYNAKVYVLGRNESKYKEVFKENINFDTQINFVECTVEDTESIKKAFEFIDHKEGKIDVLINNAFYSKGQSPEFMSDEEWSYGLEGTLTATFKCIREVIPYMKKNSSGKIINVASMYGIVAPQFEIYDEFPVFLNPPHYGASKAGIVQLTKYYASYLGTKYNINVNCVTPGPFPSYNVQEEIGFVEQLKSKTCLNRIGLPEDLAGAFTFLASNASNFITGQNIIIDGGWTIK